MNTKDFLDILEERRLVSATVVARLRERASRSADELTPEKILTYLLEKELIDPNVADELRQSDDSVADESAVGLVTDEEIPTLTPIDSRQNLRMEEFDAQIGGTSSIFDDGPAPPGELSSAKHSSLATFSSKARQESVVEELLKEPKLSEKKVPTTRPRLKKKQRSKNKWDSSLILYGGGGLLLLLIAGGVIYYLLNRENADHILQEAAANFEAGNYAQAIDRYEAFVTSFKAHPDHSTAKVKLGISKLWRDASSGANYSQALIMAKSVLSEIESEPDFRSGQSDLASLLPKIAQGLATQAEEATDLELAGERVAQTREALSLCMNTKYIPKEYRDEPLLAEVEETLLRVDRHREQSVDLAKALVAIDEALAARDIATAYNLRSALLETHPALIKNDSLTEKVMAIATVESEVVEYVDETKAAETSDHPSPLVASLTLADRTGETGNAEGNIAVRVQGALYGLRANDGSLLWRKFIGFDSRSEPIRLPNGDILYTDSVHHELVRLEGDSGKLVWRLGLEQDSFEPVVSEDRIYIAQASGRLVIVELNTGEQSGFVKFGQGLAAPPTIDTSAQRIYVLGEHSSLYTLASRDLSSLGVYYLGHPAGSIKVPAVKVLNKLIVAVNTGNSSSELIVLGIDEQGEPIAKDAERRMAGTVETPLMVEARRLIVVTTLGQISAFDIANAEGKAALSEIANREASPQASPLARFGLLYEGHVWIGDNQINKLAIQATGNSIRLSNLENDFAGDTFNAPLQTIGDLVIHVRRPASQAGNIVAATNAATGADVWQTELAVPLAGSPVVDPVGARITAVTASGAAYVLNREALARRIQDRAERLASAARKLAPLDVSVSLGQGRIAAGAIDSAVLLHFRPGAPRGPLEVLQLPGKLTSQLVAWRDGFLVPTSVGQIYFLNAEDGQQLAAPFQPPLEAGSEFSWLAPASFGDGDGSQIVASDSKQKVYLINLVTDPEPHLQSITEAAIDSVTLNTPIAVSGDLAAVGSDESTLLLYHLPEFDGLQIVKMDSPVIWGPFAVEGGFLAGTAKSQLVYVDFSGQVKWKTNLENRTPTGIPLIDGSEALIAWQQHGVSRIVLADGQIAATTELNEPLVAGPVAFANRLVLAAADGTLLVINRP